MPAVVAAIWAVAQVAWSYAVAAVTWAGTALAGNAFGGGIWGALTAAVANTALSIGINALLSSSQSRNPGPSPSEKMVNRRQATQSRTKSYGRVRVGQTVFFWAAKAGKRYYGVILNTGEIHQIVTRYLDEREVTLNGSGFVQEFEFFDDARSRVQIQEFLGASGQASPSLLNANFTEWTDAHDMAGMAGAVIVAENCSAENFATVYPSGREPNYTAVFDGTKCYDPRTATTVFTKNAALILADWITSEDGLNREVDWIVVSAQADICDQNVTNREGATIKRWELCGTYSYDQERESVRAAMGIACDAFFFESDDGKVGFYVGGWQTPDVTIKASDCRNIRLIEGQEGPSTVNGYTVTYTEPLIGYREQESAAYQIDDGQAEEVLSASILWAPNHNQAVRLAKRILLNARAEFRVSLTLKLSGWKLRKKRFFLFTHAELGFDAVPFEISSFKLSEDGLSIQVEARSVAQSDFNFDASTEEPARPRNIEIEGSSAVDAPTGLALTNVVNAGTVAIKATWDAPSNDTLMHDIRYRVSPSGDWFQVPVPQRQYYQFTPSLSSGVTYEVQVRAKRQTGYPSAWSTGVTITTSLGIGAPSAPSAFTAVDSSGTVTLQATAPNHPNHRALRFWRNSSASFAGATDLGAIYGAANSVGTTTNSPGGGTWYYYVTSEFDASARSSAVGPQSVTVAGGSDQLDFSQPNNSQYLPLI